MLEDKYLKLTNTLYKIIGFFPEEDPLKNKTKEKALEVMEGLLKQNDLEQVLKDIDVLKGYLMIGKSQGWIDNLNFLILAKEYDKVKEEISAADQVIQRSSEMVEITKSLLPSMEGDSLSPINMYKSKKIPFTENKEKIDKKANISQNLISERQKKILEILKKQKKAQVGDLKKVFFQISKRTLRRDLDGLLKKKIVVRTGEWNEVFYSLS